MGLRSLLKGGRDKPKLQIEEGAALPQHFQIIRQLGRGSYATVYEVKRYSDGQHYALKIVEMHKLSQLDRAATVEEIRLLAALYHPNIITYYEAFCDKDKLCVVTELVNGGDLGSAIRKAREHGHPLSERQVWYQFLQVALGVQYLHHNHVLHRDLKPQNIMVAQKGDVSVLKIADLGVSAYLERVFTRVTIGTPQYMAPEMWRRQPYSYSADIWALGCILHELCTLHPTFLNERTRTEADVQQQVLAGQYDPLPSRYSPALQRLVASMLQQHPPARPTIDEVLADAEVRAQLELLPQELREAAAAAAYRTQPCLPSSSSADQLARLAGSEEDMMRMNCLLPRARYPTGGGVAPLLCSGDACRRGSLSSPDLQALAAAAEAAGGGGGGAVAAAGAQRLEPDFEDEEYLRLRRRSVQVGDLLHRVHNHEGAAGNDGSVASGAGSTLEARSKSMLTPSSPSVAARLGKASAASSGSARPHSAAGNIGAEAGSGADAAAANGGHAHDLQRRSITVAAVLLHDDVHKKLGERPVDRDAELTQLKGPLPRHPYQFQPSAHVSGPVYPQAVPAAPQPPVYQHAGLQLARQATGASAAASRAVQPAAAAGSGAPTAARQHTPPAVVAAPPAAPAVPSHEHHAKKKQHGRLWRLAFGDGGSGMHQDF